MSAQCTMHYHSVHKQVNCTTSVIALGLGSLHILAQCSNVQCNDLGWQVCSLVPSSEKLAKQNIQHWSSVTEHTMLNTLSLILSKSSQNTYYPPQNCPGTENNNCLLRTHLTEKKVLPTLRNLAKHFAELSVFQQLHCILNFNTGKCVRKVTFQRGQMCHLSHPDNLSFNAVVLPQHYNQYPLNSRDSTWHVNPTCPSYPLNIVDNGCIINHPATFPLNPLAPSNLSKHLRNFCQTI